MNNSIALQHAQMFLKLIRTGKLPKEILPNSAPNYTFAQEKYDTQYYLDVFLNSSSYDSLLQSEGVIYNGE